MTIDIEKLDFAKGDGLIPTIIQDANTLRILMLGYMNKEALRLTKETKLVTFFSRSKNRLWKKGETSGNVLHVKEIKTDCDNDALLIFADPKGATCHTGSISCFTSYGKKEKTNLSIIADLEKIINERYNSPKEESYTTSLFNSGLPRIAQKVGEEGVEVALASVTDKENLPLESADLIYHLLVLLKVSDMSLNDVLKILDQRFKS